MKEYSIINTLLAKETLKDKVDYVNEKFGVKVALNFIDNIEHIIRLLKKYPYIFSKYNDITYRVVKQSK